MNIDYLNQFYYHHTKLKNISQILETGLVGKIGEASKFGKETIPRVYFSEGIEGVLATAETFQDRFNSLMKEQGKTEWENKNVEEYLGESIYLCFEGKDIKNENPNKENAFRNGCTSKNISPQELKICILRNKSTNQVLWHRDDIIKYMLANYPIDNFQNGDKYQKEEIINYYHLRYKELWPIDWQNFNLEIIDLKMFYEQFLSNYVQLTDKQEIRR